MPACVQCVAAVGHMIERATVLGLPGEQVQVLTFAAAAGAGASGGGSGGTAATGSSGGSGPPVG